MINKSVYYAHFMGIYNTPQEIRDVKTLQDLGFTVINPNQESVSKDFKESLKKYDYIDAFDHVFGSLVRSSDIFAFRALPDGRISSGIKLELDYAKQANKIIIELPSCISKRTMSKEETSEYLQEIGQR